MSNKAEHSISEVLHRLGTESARLTLKAEAGYRCAHMRATMPTHEFIIRGCQVRREAGEIDADLAFMGIADWITDAACEQAIQTVEDKSTREKQKTIEDREGLPSRWEFSLDCPNVPEDWLALERERRRIHEKITADIMVAYGEQEMADLFLNDFDEYVERFCAYGRDVELAFSMRNERRLSQGEEEGDTPSC